MPPDKQSRPAGNGAAEMSSFVGGGQVDDTAPATDTPEQMRGQAIRLATRHAFHVFPVDSPTLPRCRGNKSKRHDPDTCPKDRRGKHPVPPSWVEWSTDDPELIAAPHYFGGREPRNIGIDCEKSGAVVLDEDTPGDLERLAEHLGVKFPDTFTVETRDGRRHMYYDQPEGRDPLRNATDVHGYDVDIRGAGGYVVGPGSLHQSGAVYTVIRDAARVELPADIADALTRKATSKGSSVGDEGGAKWWASGDIPGGLHQPALISAAGYLRRRGIERNMAIPTIRDIYNRFTNHTGTPYTWDEALAELDDIYNRYAAGYRFDESERGELGNIPPPGDEDAPHDPTEKRKHTDAGTTPDPFVDWAAFWSRDRREAEWTYPDILARGRGHAIYAGHKAGKSLLMLYVVAELVSGADPHVVVYLDYEMGEDDLYERLDGMGYGPDVDLSRLRYALLPFLPPLDTAAGAHAVTQLLDQVQSDWPDHHMVVVIDTMGRAVHGEENSSDTFRAFYNHTGIELKRRGVTWARLDHAGKDPTRGQRGSSSKGDDVDVVWKLTRTENGATLRRDVARMSWVPEKVAFAIREDPLAFKRVAGDWPAGTRETANKLDELAVDLDASTRTATAALRDADVGRRRQIVVAALKWRREQEHLVDNPVDKWWESPREPPPPEDVGTTSGPTPPKPRNHGPEPLPEPLGTTPPGQTGTTGTPLRGTGVPAPATNGTTCICPCHRGGGNHGGHPCPGCDLEATA